MPIACLLENCTQQDVNLRVVWQKLDGLAQCRHRFIRPALFAQHGPQPDLRLCAAEVSRRAEFVLGGFELVVFPQRRTQVQSSFGKVRSRP